MSNPLKQSNISSCSECGGSHILRDNITGELICQSCGMVMTSTILNLGPDWRAFTPEQREKLPRTGAPINLMIHDKGLSTNIGWRNRDYSGRKLSPEMKFRVYRLRKWQHRSKISLSRNRNLSQALIEITIIQSKLNLPRNIIETASLLYRKALNANLIRGRTIQSIVAACIYLACRQCGVIRTLDEVADSVNMSKKGVARSYRFLFKELKPKVPQSNPRNHISKIVNKLSLIGETERLANNVLQKASLMKLTGGRGPAGIAAACVYISTRITGDFRTQSEVAKTAHVTEVTIRNRYKELIQHLTLEVLL